MSKFVLTLVILPFLLSACSTTGSSSASSGSSFYGMQTDSESVAIILDVSGSMGSGAGDSVSSNVGTVAVDTGANQLKRSLSGNALGGLLGSVVDSASTNFKKENLTTFAEVKREIMPFIQGMGSCTRFNVIAFNNRVHTPVPQLPQLAANQTNKDLAKNFISRFEPQGATVAVPAMKKALSAPVDTIFFLSDGQPTDSAAQLVNLVRSAKNRGVVIHTIGLGNDQDRNLLSTLAASTGGVYVEKSGFSTRVHGKLPKLIGKKSKKICN